MEERVRDTWDQDARIADIADRKQRWHADKHPKVDNHPVGSSRFTRNQSKGSGPEGIGRVSAGHSAHNFGSSTFSTRGPEAGAWTFRTAFSQWGRRSGGEGGSPGSTRSRRRQAGRAARAACGSYGHWDWAGPGRPFFLSRGRSGLAGWGVGPGPHFGFPGSWASRAGHRQERVGT